jgi:hypothetical protein
MARAFWRGLKNRRDAEDAAHYSVETARSLALWLEKTGHGFTQVNADLINIIKKYLRHPENLRPINQ